MARFVIRRLLLALPILLGVTIVVFVTVRIVPGDPVASLLGTAATDEEFAAMRASIGLDDPVHVQYVNWLTDIVRGDAGNSIAKQTPAFPVVWDAFQKTLRLAAFAGTVAVVGGVSLGLVAATRRGRLGSAASNALSLLAISVPQYSIALIAIVYVAVPTGWFPTSGMSDVRGGGVWDVLHHLILPGICAALVPLGVIARMVRSSFLDVLSADFVEALWARGLTRWRVHLHALHNVVPSALTIAGLQVGYLLGGVVFVEIIFAWPGLGLAVYQAIGQRDLPIVQAGVLISAVSFVLVNVVVDSLRGAVDPRVRR